MTLETLGRWIVDHPELVGLIAAVLLYVARSIMPRRPDPNWPDWAVALWRIEQRLLALPWDRWFGRPKLPGFVVPPYDVGEWDASEAPTKKSRR